MSNVGVCRAIQGRQGSIEEVVTLIQALDLCPGSVTSSDDCNSAIGNSGSVVLGKPATSAKRFERTDDVGPGRRTIGLYVDPKVESLASVRIEDAILCRCSYERRAGVLLLENRKNGLNIKRVKSAGVCKCRLLMANLRCMSRRSQKYETIAAMQSIGSHQQLLTYSVPLYNQTSASTEITPFERAL